MDRFEFVLVLVSLIVGLGIAELLSVFARVLRGELRAGAVHMLWSAHTLVLLLQQFWSRWVHESEADWTVWKMSIVLAPALLGYLAAATLSPSRSDASLDEYFLERRRPFFAVLALLMAAYSFEAWTLIHADGFNGADLARVGFVCVYAVMAHSERRRVQIAGAVLLIAATVAFALEWTPRLG